MRMLHRAPNRRSSAADENRRLRRNIKGKNDGLFAGGKNLF